MNRLDRPLPHGFDGPPVRRCGGAAVAPRPFDHDPRSKAILAAHVETLGHRTLLPGQADAIAAVVDGRDTLVLLPTGGGKSAVYQLAGVSIDGPTVVVSPLIALQQDQLAGLQELDLPAAALDSTVPTSHREATVQAFERAEIEFLLLSPEALADARLARPARASHRLAARRR